MFVRAIIVQYQVQFHFFWKLVIQSAQEFQKFLMAMPRKALADDFAFQDFQGGKQGRRSVADIIMSKGAATSLLERQSWLSPVQCLYLALLIDTQHQAFFRRVEIKAHHIGQFLQKLNVPGQLESTRSMRFEIVLLPQAMNGARADLLSPSHRPATPVGRALWLGLQGSLDHRGDLFRVVQWLSTAAGLNLPYSLQSLNLKPLAPERRGMSIDIQFVGDLQVLFTFGSHQQNSGAKHHLLRRELCSNPAPQLGSIRFGQNHRTCNF